MDISTQVMTYTCALAKHLNFHNAAESCHTSQPNLSIQIKKLEETLGFQLFERSNTFVKVTKKGELVVKSFKEILTKLDDLTKLSQRKQSSLSIGLFPTLAPYLLPKLVKRINNKLPKLTLTIIEDKTQRICERLEEGSLDCILAATPITDYPFEHHTLFSEAFYVAVSKKHPFACKKNLTIEDLKDEKVLLLQEGHCLRDQSLEICQNGLLPVDLSYHSASLETLKAMVAGGAGITFVPELSKDSNSQLRYIPLSDANYARHIALFWRKTSSENKTIKEFLDGIKNLI